MSFDWYQMAQPSGSQESEHAVGRPHFTGGEFTKAQLVSMARVRKGVGVGTGVLCSG